LEERPEILNAADAMRRLLLLSFALACGAISARALPTAAQIKTAFDAIDTTQNSALSLDEWDHASFALFHAADKNKNDFIDADELQGSAIAQDTFLRADSDHDGRLSVAEFMEVRRALFRIADIDRDDNLVYVEFELLIVMEQVGWTDRNHDGRIELSELRESLTNAFAQFDADHDGHLAPAEAAYMPDTEFKRFDKNRDGQLTLEEFVNGYRAVLLGG
jgi:Ca2+-binding EF-hand superfamily protein